MPIVAAEDGSLRLPNVILWAFQLNEGDLLAASREEAETFRCRFRSYGERVWAAAAVCGHPWPWIEEMLRLPMAAVSSQGTLLLPDEAAALVSSPGGSLLLAVAPVCGDGFTVEPANGRRISPRLFLRAEYVLPVKEECEVRLPEEVLWVLGLGEGDLLARETSMAAADFEPFGPAEPLEGRNVTKLGPEGTLHLPESLLRDLRPTTKLRLTVNFSGRESALRLAHHFE